MFVNVLKHSKKIEQWAEFSSFQELENAINDGVILVARLLFIDKLGFLY